MSKKIEIRLIKKGVEELLKSPEIAAEVEAVTKRIQTNAGDGYESNMQTGRYRVWGKVYAATKAAISDNYKNNTLLKALHM